MVHDFRSWRDTASDLSIPAIELSAYGNPITSEVLVSSHGPSADRFEAFARPALLAAIAAASGDERAARVLDTCGTDVVAEGLVRKRLSARAWPDPRENAQAAPEACSLALALWVGDHRWWSAIGPHLQSELIEYFRAAINIAAATLNNWQLFGAVIADFLESVGAGTAESVQASAHARLAADSWYAGEGWYSDGHGRTFDYYNSFAFHFYLPVLAYLRKSAPDLDKYSTRLAPYLQDLVALTDQRGVPVRFGRSLTYRFGALAPISVSGLSGVSVPYGYRQILESSVNHFLENGMVERSGIVERGWYGDQPSVAQHYSGRLASYWFAKSFIHLLDGPESEFWRGDETARPRGSQVLRVPGLLVSSGRLDAPTLLANHGSYDRTADSRLDVDDKNYTRLEYSSISAPVSSESYISGGLVVGRGHRKYFRARPLSVSETTTSVTSVWLLRAQSVGGSEERRPMPGTLLQRVRRRVLGLAIVRRILERTLPTVTITTATLGGWHVHSIEVGLRGSGSAKLWVAGVGVPSGHGTPIKTRLPASSLTITPTVARSSRWASQLLPLWGWESTGVHSNELSLSEGEAMQFPSAYGTFTRNPCIYATRLDANDTAVERVWVEETAPGEFCVCAESGGRVLFRAGK
ncbi:DUF2264 domain-containing protein (plasmid) [Coraliomargarita sp. W4R53]